MALKMKTKAAGAPKLAGAKKPGKAAAAKKAPPGPSFKEGQEVEFLGYADASNDSPVFEPGNRLTITAKKKDDDNKTIYEAVKSEDYTAYQSDPDSVEGDQVLPSEIKKAEKAVVDPYAIEVKAVGKLEEVLAEHGDDPLAAAQAMQEEAAENMFYFGGLVAQLYANKSFQEYGDYQDEVVDGKTKYGTGWDKFCRAELNLNGRDAQRYINIYQKFSGIDGLDWAGITKNKKIGFVKLDAMARVVTQENVTELLDKAVEVNVEDFKNVIKTDYVTEGEARQGGSGPKVKRLKVNYQLFEDQAEGVNYVLEAAAKALGLDDPNQVFEVIVMQWGATYLTDSAMAKARAAKRKVHKTLKAQGVDVSKLLEADSKLEEFLVEDEDDGAEAGEGEGSEGAEG